MKTHPDTLTIKKNIVIFFKNATGELFYKLFDNSISKMIYEVVVRCTS